MILSHRRDLPGWARVPARGKPTIEKLEPEKLENQKLENQKLENEKLLASGRHPTANRSEGLIRL
jgi:hypothetical protein